MTAPGLPPPQPLPTNQARGRSTSGGGGRRGLLLLVLAAAIAAGIVGYLLGRGSDAPSVAVATPLENPVNLAGAEPAAAPAEPTASPAEPTASPAEPTPSPAPEPTPSPAPEPSSEPPPPVPAPAPAVVPTDIGPVPADPDVEAPPDTPLDVYGVAVRIRNGEVPESRGIVKGGRIFLVGAVPDRESADQIVELAGSVLGPDNVYNFYVIDPRAADAGLGNVRVDDTVLFETDSAEIAEDFHPLLNQAVALAAIRPSVTFTIEGHTDSVGPDAYNLGLSQRRARAVADFMIERGVDPSRLTAVGKGEREPVAPNRTEEGRELNRRIQVFLFNLLGE